LLKRATRDSGVENGADDFISPAPRRRDNSHLSTRPCARHAGQGVLSLRPATAQAHDSAGIPRRRSAVAQLSPRNAAISSRFIVTPGFIMPVQFKLLRWDVHVPPRRFDRREAPMVGPPKARADLSPSAERG